MIYVFGSCNVDMVMPVSHHPKPGETILCPGYKLFTGGKGANQAVAAACAGGRVEMVGAVGQDDLAQLLLESFKSHSVGTDFLRRIAQPTGCAVISVDPQGENMILVASGANGHVVAEDFPYASLKAEDTVVLQMETPAAENWKVIRQVKEKGARVILNLAPAYPMPREVLPFVDVLIVNEHEILAFESWMPSPMASHIDRARFLSKSYELAVVVTLGGEGVVAVDKEKLLQLPAYKVEVKDTTGAGDTFAGYFAQSMDNGLGLYESLRRGVIAGALACTKSGAQASIPKMSEVLNILQTSHM